MDKTATMEAHVRGVVWAKKKLMDVANISASTIPKLHPEVLTAENHVSQNGGVWSTGRTSWGMGWEICQSHALLLKVNIYDYRGEDTVYMQ